VKPAPSVELIFFGVGAPRQSVKVECESGVRPAGARQNVSQAEGSPIIPQIAPKVKHYLHKKRELLFPFYV